MSEEKRLKVGVIGVGALGRHHARLYAQSPNAEVVGIFDVQKANAEKVGAEFGLAVYDSWQELAEKCDALSVAVPATYHASTVLPLLEMGKHVLVEKPIDAGIEGAKKMVDCAAENNVVLGVGHTERFNPAMDYFEAANAKPYYIEINRLAGYPPARPGLHPRGTEVSVILDLMIHDIDLVLAMAKSEVESFDVTASPVLSPGEDIASARIRFANGVSASITASRISAAPMRKVNVFCENMSCSLDFGSPAGVVTTVKEGVIEHQEVTFAAKNALADELEDFIRAVKATKATGKVVPTKVPGSAGLAALELAIALEEASRKNNEKYGFKFSAK